MPGWPSRPLFDNLSRPLQKDLLLPWRTISQNVEFGLELRGVAQAQRRAKSEQLLQQFRLNGFGNNYPHQLSGGMRQRAALARTLAVDPSVLLMDEPFSALDPLIRSKLQDELLDLQQKRNRTIIFVSHDLDEAFKIGNRIAIMEGGRIVQCGTPRDIFTNPINDYVAEFVTHMNPLGVLTARDVMIAGTTDGPCVDPETPIQEVIQQIASNALQVVKDGKVIGKITQGSILARLTSLAT